MSGIRMAWVPRFVPEFYRLYRSITPINLSSLPAPIATLDGGLSTYKDETVADGVRYYYVLAAVTGSPELVAFSEQIEVTAIGFGASGSGSGISGGGSGGSGGGGGGGFGDPVYALYFLSSDQTISGTDLRPHTALGSDADGLWNTGTLHFVVDAADDGKWALLTYQFLQSTESGNDYTVRIDRALAASPASFVQQTNARHTLSMGFPVSELFLLATGDVYRFLLGKNNGGSSPSIVASDERNALSIEILTEVA
jgi:hypothetical protein